MKKEHKMCQDTVIRDMMRPKHEHCRRYHANISPIHPPFSVAPPSCSRYQFQRNPENPPILRLGFVQLAGPSCVSPRYSAAKGTSESSTYLGAATLLTEVWGAKAAAEPARARVRAAVVFMVACPWKLLSSRHAAGRQRKRKTGSDQKRWGFGDVNTVLPSFVRTQHLLMPFQISETTSGSKVSYQQGTSHPRFEVHTPLHLIFQALVQSFFHKHGRITRICDETAERLGTATR